MFVSYKWLSEFLDLSQCSAEELAEKMSRTGIEVEGVQNYAEGIQGPLVVGLVEEMFDHPDSDHLRITKVKVGPDQVKQIVCGAPNVHQGAKVITALEGCVLPGDFKIKVSQLRGQESQGMLCSLQEIGFPEKVVPKEYVDGIFLLPQDAPVGACVVDYLELDDPILELSITPNRADALSMRGTAYEVGAILSQEPQFHQMTLSTSQVVAVDQLEQVRVEIEDKELADHYQLRLIKQVTVQESPIHIQSRLMKANIRPINNLVDATNYFLILYGQPLHAFDFDKLPGKQIGVRRARTGERLMTLDEVDRQLDSKDIVITADDQVVALAGVMGGIDSHVTSSTQTVLLESAIFNSQSIRTTSKRLGLRSEASARFEKGINPATVSEAGEQAAIFMVQTCLDQAQIESGVVEVQVKRPKDQVVCLPISMIKEKLGIDLNQNQLQVIFDRLGFAVNFTEDQLEVRVPARRWDIHIPADVLEEVARIYGFDNLPVTLPNVASRPAKLTSRQKMSRAIRAIAEGMGLNEVLSYVLVSPEMAKLNASSHPKVKLSLPMSEERSVLRQSMLPSMLEIGRYNKARHNKPIAFYELGKVFFGHEEANRQPQEAERLSIFLSGEKAPSNWEGPAVKFDFYDLKGVVQSLLENLRLAQRIEWRANSDLDFMHPGRTASLYIEDVEIGFLGQIHPTLAAKFDLESDSYFAELDFDRLVDLQVGDLMQTPLAKYPATSRDIALLVNRNQSHQSLVDTIRQSAGDRLVSLDLFDRYTGENIAEDKQSLAYHLTFQDPEKTLTDEDVNACMDQVIQALEAIKGLEIR